jgi:hypothetical protein
METIHEFAAAVSEALGDDFDAEHWIVEALDVKVTLVVEDGQKGVYERCILGEQGLSQRIAQPK